VVSTSLTLLSALERRPQASTYNGQIGLQLRWW
jgi:hypothetical protein